jgi:quinol monooxygenase YgiN
VSIAFQSMIIATVDIKATAETREELRRGLSSLSGPTEAEAGCTSCQLYEGVSDANLLRVESRWKETSDLFRHLRSDNYKRLLFLMELGAEAPNIEFFTVSQLGGLDVIKAAREKI